MTADPKECWHCWQVTEVRPAAEEIATEIERCLHCGAERVVTRATVETGSLAVVQWHPSEFNVPLTLAADLAAEALVVGQMRRVQWSPTGSAKYRASLAFYHAAIAAERDREVPPEEFSHGCDLVSYGFTPWEAITMLTVPDRERSA